MKCLSLLLSMRGNDDTQSQFYPMKNGPFHFFNPRPETIIEHLIYIQHFEISIIGTSEISQPCQGLVIIITPVINVTW